MGLPSHIAEEFNVIDKPLKFRFNTDTCESVQNKIPKDEDYGLFKAQRTFHFNKNTSDHVVVTVPNSEYLVLVNKLKNSNFITDIGNWTSINRPHEIEMDTDTNGEITYTLNYEDINKKKFIQHLGSFSPVKEIIVNKVKDKEMELPKINKSLPRSINLRQDDIVQNIYPDNLASFTPCDETQMSFSNGNSASEHEYDVTLVKRESYEQTSTCDTTREKELSMRQSDVNQNTHKNEELIAAISLVALQNVKENWENTIKTENNNAITMCVNSLKENFSTTLDAKLDKKSFQCDECGFKVNKKRHFDLHLRVHIKPYACNICSHTFSKMFTLESHVNEVHKNRRHEKPFKCGFCNYTTSFIKRLSHHNKAHKKETMYVCHKCNFSSLTKYSLVRHVRAHDNPKLLECDECGFITMFTDEMDLHVGIHGGPKMFKCEICFFATSHRGYFRAHMDFHAAYPSKKENPDSETKFQCDDCSFVTLMRSSLLKHAKYCRHVLSVQTWQLLNFCNTTSANEDFHCPYCDYTSFQFNELKNHAICTHCKT